MPAPLVKTALNVTAEAAEVGASVLDTVADTLRGLAGDEAPEPEPANTPAARPPVDRQHGERPAPGTRTRISNPKAAKRARAR